MIAELEDAGREDGSGAMFDAIADRYDLLNRIISLGRDQSWRRRTVEAVAAKPEDLILDVATGTADLAIMAAKLVPGTRCVGLDPSSRMLAIAEGKVRAAKLESRIELRLGDACALPMSDGAFDAAMMAFGIRNVPDRARALRELARVVKPGGRVAILELSSPRESLLAPLARLHSRAAVPWIASLLSSRREYDYLEASIRAFPSPEDFSRLMEESGLLVEAAVPLTFGVVVLFSATSRPEAR